MGYIGLKILNKLYNVPIKKLLQFDLWRIEKKTKGTTSPLCAQLMHLTRYNENKIVSSRLTVPKQISHRYTAITASGVPLTPQRFASIILVTSSLRKDNEFPVGRCFTNYLLHVLTLMRRVSKSTSRTAAAAGRFTPGIQTEEKIRSTRRQP